MQAATGGTSPDMTTVFYPWPYGRFIEIQNNLRRKKLHKTNQDSNVFGGCFSNRDHVRVPIQFRRESQPQHLKRWFFLESRPINFPINSTSVTRLVTQNQLSFLQHWNQEATSCPSPYCLIDQIQVQKPF